MRTLGRCGLTLCYLFVVKVETHSSTIKFGGRGEYFNERVRCLKIVNLGVLMARDNPDAAFHRWDSVVIYEDVECVRYSIHAV